MGVSNLLMVLSPNCSSSFQSCEMWESRQNKHQSYFFAVLQYGIDNLLCHSFFNMVLYKASTFYQQIKESIFFSNDYISNWCGSIWTIKKSHNVFWGIHSYSYWCGNIWATHESQKRFF